VLSATRAGVAWIALGCAIGAYEHALTYAKQRQQFGKPIGSFQLVQRMLVTMLGHLTAMHGMALRVSRMQQAGEVRDEHTSLAKQYCAARCRDIVALARESLGGNGILLEYDVARYFADAEAIYSYEGTNEINTLIVGRALTGVGAFV
jgi:glutaryl-CoA dehydrogenase